MAREAELTYDQLIQRGKPVVLAAHTLHIHSLHDAQAVCSCGKWSFCGTGARTRQDVEEHFEIHLRSAVGLKYHAGAEIVSDVFKALPQDEKDSALESLTNAVMGVSEVLRPGSTESYTALQLTTQALKDIINAAGNGEPYTLEELISRFQSDYNAGVEELTRQGLQEIA